MNKIILLLIVSVLALPAVAIPNAPECAQEDCSLAKLNTLRAVASRGNMEASFSLGHIFMNNDSGIKTDFENAFYYFSKAMRQGYWPAYRQVAGMLSKGLGTEKNIAEAKSVMRKAAERGVHKTAEEYALLVYLDPKSTQQELQHALDLLNVKVSEGNSYLANYLLAVIYLDGVHVRQDIEKAKQLLAFPAQGNYANSEKLLHKLSTENAKHNRSSNAQIPQNSNFDPDIEIIQVRGLSMQLNAVKDLVIDPFWNTGRQTGSRIIGNGCTAEMPGCEIYGGRDDLNRSLNLR